MRPPKVVPPELRVKLATTDEELEQAYRILYQSYLDKGYQSVNVFEQRVIKHFLPASSSTNIAVWDGQVVGTLTVVQDAELGLALDKQFDLDFLRDEGRLICEISSLAIKKEFRKKHDILLFMFHYYYVYVRQYLGLDSAVMTVHPTQIDFYKALFDFKNLPNKVVDNYAFVNGAPAVGLYHRFEELNDFFRKKASDWGDFFLDLDFECHQFPKRDLMQGFDPSMNQAILNLSLQSKEGPHALTEEEKERILHSYPSSHIVVKESHEKRVKDARFRTISKGFFRVENIYLAFRILNLSANGLMIKGDTDLVYIGKTYTFFIRHHGKVVKADVQFVWKDAKRKRAGGRIVATSESWQSFVSEFFKLFPKNQRRTS